MEVPFTESAAIPETLIAVQLEAGDIFLADNVALVWNGDGASLSADYGMRDATDPRVLLNGGIETPVYANEKGLFYILNDPDANFPEGDIFADEEESTD